MIRKDLLMYDTIMHAILVKLNWNEKTAKSNFMIFLNNENGTVIDRHFFDELMVDLSRKKCDNIRCCG